MHSCGRGCRPVVAAEERWNVACSHRPPHATVPRHIQWRCAQDWAVLGQLFVRACRHPFAGARARDLDRQCQARSHGGRCRYRLSLADRAPERLRRRGLLPRLERLDLRERCRAGSPEPVAAPCETAGWSEPAYPGFIAMYLYFAVLKNSMGCLNRCPGSPCRTPPLNSKIRPLP